MGSNGSLVVVGHPDIASTLRTAADTLSVVTQESTAAAVEYLEANTAAVRCVLTAHDPPAVDCFQLIDKTTPAVPVVVAVGTGSSALATNIHRQGAAKYIDLSTIDDQHAVLAGVVEDALNAHTAETEASDTAAGSASTAQLDAKRDHVEEFVSIISHELRTPVQKANSGLDLIDADCDSKYIDDVRETLRRMEELLDELISIVKYGDTVEETTALDLETIVTETWPNAPNATLSVESSLPTVEAEESRLRQVFENLFRNAIEQASGEAQIRVGRIDQAESTASADATAIYVADNGPGIPPEKREKVFEYGYTGSEDGTGLGLAIVDRIVAAFGWEIALTESHNGGARFEIRNIGVA